MWCADIKTAFDEARPRHVAKIMESHNTHGWIVSALLREMSGLEGQAMFKCVESKFSFNRCLRQGSVEAPRLRQKMAIQLLANGTENWLRKKLASFETWRDKEHTRSAASCGPTTTSGSCPIPKVTWNRC